MEDIDFIRALRSALNNLYEPDQLRANPLTALLGFEGRIDAPAALAEAITAAIEDVREGGQDVSGAGNSTGGLASNPARAWLAHDVLHYRYVRGYAREEVARKLNLSDRQLSRELRTAQEMLAMVLWRNHPAAHASMLDATHLIGRAHEEGSTDDSTEDSTDDSAHLESALQESSEATSWLHDLPAESPAGWREVLESVLVLLQPLLEEHQSYLHVRFDTPIANLLVAQNTLRQCLLILLGWLIPVARGRTIVLLPDAEGGMLRLRWNVDGAGIDPAEATEALEIPRQLLLHRGGSLVAEVEGGEVEGGEVEGGEVEGGEVERAGEQDSLSILLTIPALAQVPVLVIDDNHDTIQLFQRCVQGTRYALVGVSTPDEVPRALERVQPRIILLDVMMPQVDGWDMLARLRQITDADHLSIIVCSIMPLESVARSLGANGFLQKPVLPQALLQTLDLYAG